MSDCVFPLVFPDYLIAVPRPSIKIDLPDFLPFDDVIEDFLDDKTTKVPELGHAGVLFINDRGKTGVTKYYEYGRYRSNLGETRRRPMPDCKFIDGRPDIDSLKAVFQNISRVAGQSGRISSAYIETPGKYNDMLAYAMRRIRENENPQRVPYDIMDNSCVHFTMGVVEAAGVKHEASILDARPISYINSLHSKHPDVEFGSGTLTIEGW
jgi:hypothetical protein